MNEVGVPDWPQASPAALYTTQARRVPVAQSWPESVFFYGVCVSPSIGRTWKGSFVFYTNQSGGRTMNGRRFILAALEELRRQNILDGIGRPAGTSGKAYRVCPGLRVVVFVPTGPGRGIGCEPGDILILTKPHLFSDLDPVLLIRSAGTKSGSGMIIPLDNITTAAYSPMPDKTESQDSQPAAPTPSFIPQFGGIPNA